ncbi:cytidine deaminase [Streptosporangium canum]|uniref:cytidine deaminase n=1 Tax=Streptosporangium canum TaxID=324952 RepID=UPI00369349E3
MADGGQAGWGRTPRADYPGAVSDATLDPEDNKIIVLARSARARNGAAEGAAVRDETGRTYSATNVALPSLTLSALQVAVAMAVSSGAESLEAAALVTAGDGPAEADARAVREMGGRTLLVATPDGAVRQS